MQGDRPTRRCYIGVAIAFVWPIHEAFSLGISIKIYAHYFRMVGHIFRIPMACWMGGLQELRGKLIALW